VYLSALLVCRNAVRILVDEVKHSRRKNTVTADGGRFLVGLPSAVHESKPTPSSSISAADYFLDTAAVVIKLPLRPRSLIRPLRDVQVQLEGLARFRANGVITDFKRSLKRRENAKIKNIRKDLKSGKRRRLEDAIANLRSDFEILVEALEDDNVRRSIEQVVRLRRSEFFKARRRFKPGNDETLHQMRIALKKLRYVVEGGHPIPGDWAKESADEMHAYQQLMGNARDIEILRAHLQKWAAKRGKMLAIVPVLDRLAQKRAGLIKSIAKSSDILERIFPIRNSRPSKETTRTEAQSQRRSGPSPTVEPATGQKLPLVPILTNTSRTISR